MDVKEFLQNAYTSYHAAELGAQMLAKSGFVNIDNSGATDTNVIGYYRISGGALLAYKVGNRKINAVISHTDSPSLRIRYVTGGESAPSVLDTEKYGGGLVRTYLDRKLKIAGRIVTCRNGVTQAQTVCSPFDIVIPSLAVHLGGGKEGESLTASRDLRPLLGGCDDLYAALGVSDGVDGDLFCVPSEQPFTAGASGEYLCAPRIDNLVSVYASLRAISECKNKASCIAACFNNEETGSETREGAQSRLLHAFVADVLQQLKSKASADSVLSKAFVLSCDGAHALHPNHRDKYSDNAPVLGGGVVIKRNDRYATDAMTAAVAKEIFARAGKKTQTYFHHPDLRCGSTVGLTAAHLLGAYVCDIGVAQLAMHSALETAALADIEDLQAGLTEFYGLEIDAQNNQITIA